MYHTDTLSRYFTTTYLQCVLYTHANAPASALFTSTAVVVVVPSWSCTRSRHRGGRAGKKGSLEILLHLRIQTRQSGEDLQSCANVMSKGILKLD